ncbi:PilZ domain protein [Enhygromyxa salina]|uniref:PilZ domain protein n=1 Tax=Enhygromyxa salina TaxID=215803 RepID=A0A2S9YE31_9BACT|nr:PilZ domain-containing protein [Enhygromyxa salina]PRQ03355.1 PilZ domain protein [Enhygromyxa salina]
MDGGQERRTHPRVELRSVGTIDMGDHVRPCQTIDLSTTGLALVTPIRAPLRVIRVRFQLGSREAAWTEVEASVVRSYEWGDGQNHVWALRLQPMDLGTRTRVRGFLAAQQRN